MPFRARMPHQTIIGNLMVSILSILADVSLKIEEDHLIYNNHCVILLPPLQGQGKSTMLVEKESATYHLNE